MEVLKFKDVTVAVSYNSIKLTDDSDGSITFSPGESTLIRELVGTGWKMTSLPALPPRIGSDSEFTIIVQNDNIFEIVHNSNPTNGFKYNFNLSHKVIEAIDAGVAKLRDLVTLRPQRSAVSGEYSGGGPDDGDLIEGIV